MPIETNNDEIKSCIDKLNDKFDAIAADNMITKDEKEAYAMAISDAKLETVKIIGDALQAKDDANQALMEKMKQNCAKVIISFLLTAFGTTITILTIAGVISEYWGFVVTTWAGIIVSAIIGLIMNGYLNGSVWLFLGNALGFLKSKIPANPLLDKTAKQVEADLNVTG